MYKKVVRRYVRNTYTCTYVIHIDVCILKIWKNMKQVATVWFTLGITKLWQLFVVWKDDNCISIFRRYTGSLLILNTHTQAKDLNFTHDYFARSEETAKPFWVSHSFWSHWYHYSLSTGHILFSLYPPVSIVSSTCWHRLSDHTRSP